MTPAAVAQRNVFLAQLRRRLCPWKMRLCQISDVQIPLAVSSSSTVKSDNICVALGWNASIGQTLWQTAAQLASRCQAYHMDPGAQERGK